MKQTALEYFKSIKGKKVYFLGAGISHRELIVMFAQYGAQVTLCDKQDERGLGEFALEIKRLGVATILGEGYLSSLCDADIIFRSPGIDYTKPEIQAAVAQGKTVTSEIETFFKLCPARTIGVTGSDGKTTTTTLIAKILERQGYRVHLGGNIGTPLLPRILEVEPSDISVVELSSFQLISMRSSPDFAVVTNLAPNHLDHHKDMKEYVDAKRNVLRWQSESGVAVLNADNDITREMAADVKGELRWFSHLGPVDNGVYIDNEGSLVKSVHGERTVIMNLADIKLPGEHNKENVATAAAAVFSLAGDDTIRDVASEFTGVEHRIELTRVKDGVWWYNDSIGTSPTRTIAGLRSFEKKVILIAGGYDKHISYAPLAPEIALRVKHLLLCGPTAASIRAESEAAGASCPIEDVADMAQAVQRANMIAREGDIVLMSPASASFDAYPNFEARGEHFKKLVGELK
ncbi:MAG: UDP-N-acetylmuramoyl-L-alanine--D-glutamate ligase [Oscillospiraceae bacterium]